MIDYFLPSRAATKESLGHPAAGVLGWFDPQTNTTGEAVTEDTALAVSAVWCAYRILSETVGTLPCILYRRTSEDSRERATDDSRYRLIHDQPHPMISPITFFESQTGHLVSNGNCYSKIVYEREGAMSGRIRALEPRAPRTVKSMVEGDELIYKVTQPQETLFASEMLHVLGLGGDGLTGWSVVKRAQQSFGIGLAADRYAGSQLGNGAVPTGAITHPQKLNDKERAQYRREWNEIHQGGENAGKIAILHGGIGFQELSMNNEDLQLLGSRKFTVREIARWFRLPPHMLADLEDSSVRANIEQQAIEFVVYSLMPWLVRWQQILNRTLLSETERSTLYFEFLLDSLLKGDQSTRYAAYATAIQNGWLSVNEVRRRENMNAIQGGDVYLSPLNMIPSTERTQIPDTIRDEMQKNLADSFGLILSNGRQLRRQLETMALDFETSIASFGETTSAALESARADREEMRKDIEQVRQPQVPGYDPIADVREASTSLARETIAKILPLEKQMATKAARRAIHRGDSFLKWLENWYPQHAGRMMQKLSPSVTPYCRLAKMNPIDCAKHLAQNWCDASVSALLTAADGDKNAFESRVTTALEGFDERLEGVELCTTRP